jgi:integrase
MTEQAISPLRRRMIEDMTIRKFAQKTQHDYVHRVKEFASYLKRSPDTAKPEDVRGFQLHLTSSGAGTPKINATVAALRFFFRVTLDRPDLGRHLSTIHRPRKAPLVLSPDEVARFLEAAPGIKYKAAFSVAYGAGLRVSEVASLKVSDIDSKRMMLRLEGRFPESSRQRRPWDTSCGRRQGGNGPSTARRHFRPRSGSTPHDEISQPSPKSRSPVCSLLSWPRFRSLRRWPHRRTAPPVFTGTLARTSQERIASQPHQQPHRSTDPRG